MGWVLDHAPQIVGCVFFCGIVYMLLEELLNKKNNHD
jgi:hypothetical protein